MRWDVVELYRHPRPKKSLSTRLSEKMSSEKNKRRRRRRRRRSGVVDG
jgi:hypothetical protein